MERSKVEQLLEAVQSGNTTIESAVKKLSSLPYKDLGHTKLDVHRELRKGYPEVIYCEGKSDDQVISIFHSSVNSQSYMMGTRVSLELSEAVKKELPQIVYFEKARILLLGEKRVPQKNKKVAVVSAGTSDQAVAEEAAVTADIMGSTVERIYDVGVTGLQRLLAHVDQLQEASVVIVVAGMEGALASVVGGLVNAPVLCVPTSVGYGSHLNGIVPLLAMLNSCAPGSSVLNIDNGFGAGYTASLIVNQ